MRTHPLQPKSTLALLARLTGLCLVLALFATGWALIADQQWLLWVRLPASAVERFVADQVSTRLPRLPGVQALQAVCTEAPSWRAQWRRAWLSEELANCINTPEGLTKGEAARSAIGLYEGMMASQVKAAQDWLTEYETQSARHRTRLQAELLGLQSAPPPWTSRWLPASPSSVRDNKDALATPERTLRKQLESTQAKVKAMASGQASEGERARQLALLATGLQWVTDYGEAPPAVRLGTDRNTLAEALEWQRRARGYQERGFDLSLLHKLPLTLLVTSVLLLGVVALTSRCSPLVLGLWTLATQLLGWGALMLTDVALTGDPSLRYFVVRQFQGFGLGDWWLPLTLPLPAELGAPAITLWWPLLLVAVGLLLLRGLRQGQGWATAPVRAWVYGGGHVSWGVVQSVLLVGAGTLMVLLLGMPAAISELLILMGCVGVASYLARQAPFANAGAGLQTYNLLLVAAALALAVLGSLARGDLGHVLVALLLATCFAWLFGWAWLRATVLLCALAALAVLTLCLMAGELTGPLAALVQWLPAHAQDRIHAMFDPFHAGSSDLARVSWLMRSADLSGWGVGYAPWQGLSAARLQDGLPLQGPSDYVLSLAITLWGQAGGLLLLAVVLMVFCVAALLGLRTALAAAIPVAVRWLAAVGGFGCLVMAAKVVLSVGGVTGVLPLTGLPVGLLGYGPVTHLAALLYLALALGTLHVRALYTPRGVEVHAQPVGAVRRRGLGLALVGVAVLSALLGLAFWHLRADWGVKGQRHLAQDRLELAQKLTQAIVPKTLDQAMPRLPCAELGYAIAAWNQRLSALMQPVRVSPYPNAPAMTTQTLHLDGARLMSLLNTSEFAGERACHNLAHTLGQMQSTDMARLVGREAMLSTTATNTDAKRLSVFDKPRSLGARPLDYATSNAWWGQPGCLLPADTLANLAPDQAHPAKACAERGTDALWTTDTWITQVATDIWLQRNMAPQWYVALRTPVAQKVLNHHPIAVGPALGVTLVPQLQQFAQRTVDCSTGRLHGDDCQAMLPKDPVWQQRHFGDGQALRTGAMGMVVAEVDSGRVVALAGAVSDCTLAHLGQTAKEDGQGRLPALTTGSRCAQLPDKRSDWLALQHPALWMVPPGSSLKPLSLVAGMDAGVVGAGQDAYWKSILAESHEREPIQRTALSAGKRYLDVLAGVGFGKTPPDLLWGSPGDNPKALNARWTVESYAGTSNLRSTRMPLSQAEQIRAQKVAGVNVDKRYGPAVMGEFLAARRLADASVGGGDIRINAWGLVDVWRALDLRSRGKASATPLHLMEQPGRAVPTRPLNWASVQAASRALGMTTGVTSSAWKGTAQGSCRLVFGACPAQGLSGVSGKTGSSDFLTEEDGPYVKPGMQLPAKLFGGVFGTPDGKRYAVAVMALRVREGSTRTLELRPSAPAEAALTMMRQMGVNGF